MDPDEFQSAEKLDDLLAAKVDQVIEHCKNNFEGWWIVRGNHIYGKMPGGSYT